MKLRLREATWEGLNRLELAPQNRVFNFKFTHLALIHIRLYLHISTLTDSEVGMGSRELWWTGMLPAMGKELKRRRPEFLVHIGYLAVESILF